MNWISKDQPQYIFLDDTWIRETDDMRFFPNQILQCWQGNDGSRVFWTKKSMIMKHRD